MDLFFKKLIVFSWIVLSQARHWCVRYKPDSEEPPEKIWCDSGCCGQGDDIHCCHIKSEFEIVEGVLGALGGFFIILTIVVTLICCRIRYLRSKRHQMTVSAVSSGTVTEVKTTQPSAIRTTQLSSMK